MSKKERCSICLHKKRCAIDQCATNGETYRQIAAKFNVGYSSVKRHVDNGHVDKAIQAAANDKLIQHGSNLQQRIDEAYNLCLEATKIAKKNDIRAFGGCAGALMKALELQQKIQGDGNTTGKSGLEEMREALKRGMETPAS